MTDRSTRIRSIHGLLFALIASGVVGIAPAAGQLSGSSAETEPDSRRRDGDAAAGQNAEPDDERLVEEIVRHDRAIVRRLVGTWSARASPEHRLSATIGLLSVRQPAAFDCTTTCEFRGLLVQAETGLGGVQLSVGHARLVGETLRSKAVLRHVFLGYAVKGAMLRTWGAASSEPVGRSYVGLEADLTAVMVNFSLGVFRHVGGAGDDDPWLVTGSVGWGF